MKNLHRYFLNLAYNGQHYVGWQVQKNGDTVQAQINEAMCVIFKEKINVTGCGRTDTGVHAREFFAHFDLTKQITGSQIKNYVNSLNGFLPKDIVVFNIQPVIAGANARFDALSRTYKYYVVQQKDPFLDQFAYVYHIELDIDIMNKATQVLFEYNDFTSFSKVRTQVKTNNCKIHSARWAKAGHTLVFTITADRFLRNMVRAIVGTLIDVGRHKITMDDFRSVIGQKDRSMAGFSVPAHGLFLHSVKYPENIFIAP
jgi:tRNA pseudouridine38-40 synthase